MMAEVWPFAQRGETDDPRPGDEVLEVLHLSKSFGPRRALDDASLSVRHGEIVAVMGPSGSGKSTLLHCAAGVVRPDSGQVLYRGADVTRLPRDRSSELRRTQFGFVFQFGQLVPELDAVENVALPLLLNGSGRREAKTIARTWLDRLSIGDLAGQRPGQMSGGQAQRVAVARALVTCARVVFADEPTGSLDTATSFAVMAEMVELAREHGTAIVVVTHDAQVAAYADRVVGMRDGRTEQERGDG